MSKIRCYALFSSNTDALALFEELKNSKIGARIAPTPRAARASCGTSLLIPCNDEERVREAAEGIGVRLEDIVHLENQIQPLRDHYC